MRSDIIPFDPLDHQQDPARGLTLAIRQLRLGGRIRLPNGTMIASVTMMNGSSQERRFAVAAPGGSVKQAEKSAYRTASQAAARALGREH